MPNARILKIFSFFKFKYRNTSKMHFFKAASVQSCPPLPYILVRITKNSFTETLLLGFDSEKSDSSQSGFFTQPHFGMV